MKEEIKNLKNSTVHQIFEFAHKTLLSYCLKCRQKTGSKYPRVQKQRKKR